MALDALCISEVFAALKRFSDVGFLCHQWEIEVHVIRVTWKIRQLKISFFPNRNAWNELEKKLNQKTYTHMKILE